MFTDDDLKRLKEILIQDLDWPCEFDNQGVLNLLARLEAAERIVNDFKSLESQLRAADELARLAREAEYGPYSSERYPQWKKEIGEALAAWEKVRGNK